MVDGVVHGAPAEAGHGGAVLGRQGSGGRKELEFCLLWARGGGGGESGLGELGASCPGRGGQR